MPVTGTDVLHNDFEPGVLPLADDASTVVFTPKEFRICGERWDFAFVNSNGSVSFDFHDNSPVQSVAAFLGGPPRIAGLWTDLDPSAGGTVSFDRSLFTLTVSFTDVPEFGAVDPNSFDIELVRLGGLASIAEIDYGDLAALNGIAGVSCGGDATTGTEPERNLVNFGTIGLHTVRANGAVYENFDAGDVDLANTKLFFTLLPF